MIKSTLSIAVALTLTACGGSGGTSAPVLLDDTSSDPVSTPVEEPSGAPAVDTVSIAEPTPAPDLVVPVGPTPAPVEPVALVTPEPDVPAPTVEPVTVTPEPTPEPEPEPEPEPTPEPEPEPTPEPEPEPEGPITVEVGVGMDTGTVVDVEPLAFRALVSNTWRESWACSLDATPDVESWTFDLDADGTGRIPGDGGALSWVTELDTLTISGAYDFAVIEARDSPDYFDENGNRITPQGFYGYTPEGEAVTCAKQGETYTQTLTAELLITGPVGFWECSASYAPADSTRSYRYQYFMDGTATSIFTGEIDRMTGRDIATPASEGPPDEFSWTFDADTERLMMVTLPQGLEYLTFIGGDVAGSIGSYPTYEDRYAPSASCTKYR